MKCNTLYEIEEQNLGVSLDLDLVHDIDIDDFTTKLFTPERSRSIIPPLFNLGKSQVRKKFAWRQRRPFFVATFGGPKYTKSKS